MEIINNSAVSNLKATLFLEKWADAIESRNINNVMKLYHPDAVLWGEYSDFLRFTTEEIEDYFYHFIALENLSIKLKSTCIQSYGDITLLSGIYEFSYLGENLVGYYESRFTFSFKQINDEWKIINHHSSLIPEEVY